MFALTRLATAVVLPAMMSLASGAFAQTPVALEIPDATVARLQHIIVPLIRHMDRPIPLEQVRVKVLTDDSINAANGRDGQFYVTTGLLERSTDDQLHAVLAHEVAVTDLALAARDRNDGFASDIARMMRTVVFRNRTEESAADAHAVELLHRLGKDGQSLMIETLRWLAKNQGDSGGFFATDPPSPARIKAVKSLH